MYVRRMICHKIHTFTSFNLFSHVKQYEKLSLDSDESNMVSERISFIYVYELAMLDWAQGPTMVPESEP